MGNEPSGPQKTIDVIVRDVDWCIGTFQRSAGWYRWHYFVTSLSTVLLSALITVIAGWRGHLTVHDPNLQYILQTDRKNIILVLGAVSTVVSAWGLFFAPKKSWLIFQDSANRLHALKMRIRLLQFSSVAIDEKTASGIVQDFSAIMEAQNKAWLELREATDAPAAKKQAAG